jgi:divalent metal cation (Fe/Co/Zn/Cd) transporter
MPLLAYRKIKAAAEIRDKALIADAKETLAWDLLSVALLLGLGLNYVVGV